MALQIYTWRKEMKQFKRLVLVGLILAILLTACGCAFGGRKKIGKDSALQAALDHAGLTADQVKDIDIEYERGVGSSWYEVDLESGIVEYDYKVDAFTGEVLASAMD